ncbi:MAG: hypothetical protein OXH22_04770 [Chloroflexi bacterium]|nr:hypothetical protein [Chloroflexota bacterium]
MTHLLTLSLVIAAYALLLAGMLAGSRGASIPASSKTLPHLKPRLNKAKG